MAEASTAQQTIRDMNVTKQTEISGVKPVATTKVSPIQKKQSSARPKPKFNLNLWLRQWHQRAGLFAFFFMGWLGISGFLLNQSADWGLDAIRVKAAPIMAMYGLYPQLPENAYYDGSNWLVTTTENSVLSGHRLAQQVPSPLGMVAVGKGSEELLYIATDDSIVIFDNQGQRIEELSGYMLPAGHIRRLGELSMNGKDYVAIQGESVYATADGFSWQPVDDPEAAISWSEASEITDEVRSKSLAYARPTVALEQLLIDLHSGRLFGKLGSWLINFVGIASVFLSITGIWMYWRTQSRRRPKPRS
jgi:hypothetical protein